ncbi:YisL family protein [Niallia taxi]|uniref:YisL family protein n=1 Tax=Niallia taxi TaxID=2499688 RepID=UPI00119D57D8
MGHIHITAWALALILFVISLLLFKGGKEKGSKIVHMVLRLMYLAIIGTGVTMLTYTGLDVMHTLKTLVGLWVIASLEMILIRTKKEKKTIVLWIQFVVALIIVLYLGFTL